MTDDASEPRDGLRASELMKLGELAMTSEREEYVHVISLFGELDLATVDQVRDQLELAEASDVVSIVVDLSGLTFMDSTGIRLLIEAHERSHADGNRLMLLRGGASVHRVLEVAGVAEMLPFAD
jgi:anti-sigma B factor antagonist